ncbi:MAG: hypothetical protein GXP16_11710 [Gammaproteobacteria bacterium]|nr:hypothetical protein [Gammaproteobacteria bacterium]
MHIGLLHPGEMGVSIGRALDQNGHTVLCCGVGRSSGTQDRARAFQNCNTLEELAMQACGIISVCPPAAALTSGSDDSQLWL